MQGFHINQEQQEMRFFFFPAWRGAGPGLSGLDLEDNTSVSVGRADVKMQRERVSASFLLLITGSLLGVTRSNGLQNITAVLGHNVILPCQTPSSAPIRAAEWSRPDQVSQYVFFYRNKQSDTTHQHPSFKDRVELADSQIKDGNLSLILKKLIINDTGKYECRVSQETTSRQRRAVIQSEPISIVHLQVTESRNRAGKTGNGQREAGLCLSVITVIYLSSC